MARESNAVKVLSNENGVSLCSSFVNRDKGGTRIDYEFRQFDSLEVAQKELGVTKCLELINDGIRSNSIPGIVSLKSLTIDAIKKIQAGDEVDLDTLLATLLAAGKQKNKK